MDGTTIRFTVDGRSVTDYFAYQARRARLRRRIVAIVLAVVFVPLLVVDIVRGDMPTRGELVDAGMVLVVGVVFFYAFFQDGKHAAYKVASRITKTYGMAALFALEISKRDHIPAHVMERLRTIPGVEVKEVERDG